MKSFTLLCMIRISVVIFDTQGFVEIIRNQGRLLKNFPNSCCMIVASLLWMWEKYYLFQKTSVNKSTISFHGSTCLSLWSLLKQKTLLFWAGFDNRVKMQSLIGWICFNKSIILSIPLIFFSWDHLLVLSKKISLCMAQLTKVWAAWPEEVFEAMACTLT